MTSENDFDLDALKNAMKAATPAADPDRRASNLRLAEENFAKMHPEQPRKGWFVALTDKLSSFGTAGGLTATTAVVAAGFLFFTPQGQDLLQPGTAQLPSAPPAIEPAEAEADVEAIAATSQPEIAEATADDLLRELSDTTSNTGEALLPGQPTGGLELEGLSANGQIVGDVFSGADPASPEAFSSEELLAPMEAPTDGDFATEVIEAPLVIVEPTPQITLRTEMDGGEAFSNADSNPVRVTALDPVSTFSIDVDTASYAIIRQSLMTGNLPPADAVRIEEMINYFPYDYTAPAADSDIPFEPNIGLMQTPWNEHTQLLHIGLQGTLPAIEDRDPLNLVFLIDTSGSMDDAAKLPLLRQSLLLMLDQLDPRDEVAIVTYAGSAGVVLGATPATERATISAALDRLNAGGSTNGQGGLEQAYTVARAMTAQGEVSRVILATDGDFNVGLSDPAALTDYIAGQRETGVFLSVLGFGRGNLDDATMQALAQNGNGIAAYIDTLNEAQKVLVDQLTGALFAIASDVKIQIEFNPGVIGEYRLIGYETRALTRQDFNDDTVDAGELGAGHSVTAIYEITPVGSPALLHDPLRYQNDRVAVTSPELAFLRLRWKAPGSDESQLFEMPIIDTPTLRAVGSEARFAAAIAGYGELLRNSGHQGGWDWDDAIALALSGQGDDPFGYRREAVQLMRLAQSLSQD